MDESVKKLIEKACSLSIETAEIAFQLGSGGGRDPQVESRMLVSKADYEAAVEVLREADPAGFKANIAQVAEVTRWAMQNRVSGKG
jgi:hypothetical protein